MKLKVLLLTLLLLALFAANIVFGAVSLAATDVWAALAGGGADETVRYIIVESRLPAAVTALVAGAGLGTSGLMLQTAFHNPLAGPSVMGISGGASLGVALVMLLTGGTGLLAGVTGGLGGYVAVIAAALIGALAITALLLVLSAIVDNHLVLLIVGMMTSYLISSVITLLTYSATAEGVQSYVVWGMGDFSTVSLRQVPWLAAAVAVALAASLPLSKALNAYQLGSRYAESLGFSSRRTRHTLLVTTGLLAAVITAFCGPVSFLGLAVPHIARLVARSDDFRLLMPVTMIVGGAAALVCNLLCNALTETTLPLAAVTPVIGAPIVLWVIIKRR